MNVGDSMTLSEIRQRVAEGADFIRRDAATGKSVPITTQPAADRLDRAIRDGIAEFSRSNSWAFLDAVLQVSVNSTGTAPLSIDGDPSRLLLPPEVRSVPHPTMAWKASDGSYVAGHAGIRSFSEIVGFQFADSYSLGPPVMFAVQGGISQNVGMFRPHRFEMRIWPKPDREYDLAFACRLALRPPNLDDEIGPWPSVHDLTIVAFAVREAIRADGMAGNAEAMAKAEARVSESLAISIQRDNEDHRSAVMSPSDLLATPSSTRFTLYGPSNELVGTYLIRS